MKSVKIILVVILPMIAQLLHAQTKNDPWTIGIWGVKTEYIGDLGTNAFKFGNNFHAGGALSFDRYISRFFDAGIYGSISSIGMENGISTYADFDQWLNRSELGNEVQNFNVERLYNFNLHTRFKIGGNEKARIVPYIGVAAGMAFYNHIRTSYIDANGNRQTMNYQRPGGGWHDVSSVNAVTLGGIVGLEWRISPVFSLRYQANGSWTDHDNRDFRVKGIRDLQLQHNIGLTFNFSGKRKDTDGDGVADYVDRCPKIFGDPQMQGCPKDTDGDGVPDHLDLCLGTPKGVVVDENGCPKDTGKDSAPDVPETQAEVKTDKKVCQPDTDGDGVTDDLDKCPNEPGLPENKGCPYNPVLFAFGKATFNAAETTNMLDSIAGVLTRQPAYISIISGHTDSIGNAAYNQALSIKRAGAVKQYLIQKGVDESRITVQGYGFDLPAADNKTREGRAKNRRVEVVILLKE